MSRIPLSRMIASFALAAGFGAPAAAQDSNWQINQAQVRPGVLGPGVAGIAPDGQVVPGGDIEAQTLGDGNIGMRLLQVYPYEMSGGSGDDSERPTPPPSVKPYYLAIPFDPSAAPSQR